MVLITFEIEVFLASYLKVRYGQSVESPNRPGEQILVVRFSSHDVLYHRLHELTVPSPGGLRKEVGNVTIVLPSPRGGKSPERYNYVGKAGVWEFE